MAKARIVENEMIATMLREVPLKLRLQVLNTMMIQTHLIEIGVIPDGFWSDAKERKYGKLFRKFTKEMTKNQMKEIQQWEKDGRPK